MVVKLFGLLAEAAGSSTVEVKDSANTQALVAELSVRYPALKEFRYAIAIDRQLVREKTEIPSGAEVALLPPFAGG